MCASYGIGGRYFGDDALPFDLDPLSEPQHLRLLNEWALQHSGNAKITGRKALNLNPLIHAFAGERSVHLAWWWLWRDGGGPVQFSAFNSREDRLLRSWRAPFQRRALLPATWYVEKGTQFGLPDGELFAMAAVTSLVHPEGSDDPLLTYSLVTRSAVGAVSAVHDRMPLVLPKALHDEWLDPQHPGDEELVSRVRFVSEQISEAFVPLEANTLF